MGDVALYLPLLLVFHKTLADMRRLYVLAQVFLFVTVLAPIFWDGWVVTGVGVWGCGCGCGCGCFGCRAEYSLYVASFL